MKEIRLLKANEIECRVGTCNQSGFSLLLYKDARVDMSILDETFGNMNWQREHKEIKGNLYCGVSIWDAEKQQWITKWDCGIESIGNDGNEKKGESSDSFKRSCFCIGIGRELYTAPFIWISGNVEKSERTGKYVPVKEMQYLNVSEIDYNENREISRLVIVNKNGVVFEYGTKQPVQKTNVIKTEQVKAEMVEESKKTETEPTILEAMNCTTPKGAKLNDLTCEQLNQIANNPKYSDYIRKCAKMLSEDKDIYVRDDNGEILF